MEYNEEIIKEYPEYKESRIIIKGLDNDDRIISKFNYKDKNQIEYVLLHGYEPECEDISKCYNETIKYIDEVISPENQNIYSDEDNIIYSYNFSNELIKCKLELNASFNQLRIILFNSTLDTEKQFDQFVMNASIKLGKLNEKVLQ